MLEKLDELKQEKQVIENMMNLRRERHSDTIKELKAEAEQKERIEGRPSQARNAYIDELDAKFEAGLQEEFKDRIQEVDDKIKIAVVELKKEIENKDKEIAEQKRLVDEKDLELARAKGDLMRIYRQTEGEILTTVDTSHIDRMSSELSELRNGLNSIKTQRNELYAKLQEFEPQAQENITVEEVAPAEAEPTEAEPTEAEPTEAEPTEAEPTEAEPTEVEPAEAEPAEAEPTEAEPTEAEPTEAEPAEATSAEVTPVEAIPVTATNTTNQVEEHEEDEEGISIYVGKEGTIISIDGEEGKTIPLSEEIDLDSIPDINKEILKRAKEVGDKFVIRSILTGKLSTQEKEEKLENYISMLTEPEKYEEEVAPLHINYNLKGLSKSGLSKEDRKILEAHAKRARDLDLEEVTVEAPWSIKAKWFVGDIAKKMKLDKFWNKATSLLPKRKEIEKLGEGNLMPEETIVENEATNQQPKTDRLGNTIEKTPEEEAKDEEVIRKSEEAIVALDNVEKGEEK